MKHLIGSIVAIAIVLGITVAIAAPPPIIAPRDRKFDHAKHAVDLGKEGKPALDCAGCHKVNPADGRVLPGRDHARCTGCHDLDVAKQSCDLVKVPGPKSPARQCAVCHVATRAECLPPDMPAPPRAPSFVAHFEHNKHIALGPVVQKDCAFCHRAEVGNGADPSGGHAACAGCHNGRGIKIAMNECAGCHVTSQATHKRPSDVFSVAPFDHAKHRAMPGAARATCVSCHAAIATAPENAIPAPTMASCEGSCHDGKQAFSAVGTACARCHRGTDAPAKQRTDLPFSHASHANRHVNIAACADCHTLTADGALEPPGMGKNHLPCANSGCHQTDYASRAPKICGVCHDAEAPWAHAIARAGKVITPEWGETINHRVHLQIAGSGNQACAGCHGDQLAAQAAPTQHKGCATGGKCHGGTQAPPMAACATCHQATTVTASGAARRSVSAWSVATTFKHVVHANDPRTRQETKCAECHASVTTANDLATIKSPTMGQCGSCHDGKTAFKTTGYECARCHGKGPVAPTSISFAEAPR